jgi:hypothetical protein
MFTACCGVTLPLASLQKISARRITPRRMHGTADVLPDSELVHERADQHSARAQQH